MTDVLNVISSALISDRDTRKMDSTTSSHPPSVIGVNSSECAVFTVLIFVRGVLSEYFVIHAAANLVRGVRVRECKYLRTGNTGIVSNNVFRE